MTDGAYLRMRFQPVRVRLHAQRGSSISTSGILRPGYPMDRNGTARPHGGGQRDSHCAYSRNAISGKYSGYSE